MKAQMEIALKRVRTRGNCIAIGHVHKKNLPAVIREYIPRFKAEGVEFVYLTDMASPQVPEIK
jgi:polysaccharide deacetylase 2 family uncharacterized protein YibQ